MKVAHLSNWGIDRTCGHDVMAQFITLGNFFNFSGSPVEQSVSQWLELGLLHHQWRSAHLLTAGRNTWWICPAPHQEMTNCHPPPLRGCQEPHPPKRAPFTSGLQNTTATANPKWERTKLAPDKLATFGNRGFRFVAPGYPLALGDKVDVGTRETCLVQQDLCTAYSSGLEGRW